MCNINDAQTNKKKNNSGKKSTANNLLFVGTFKVYIIYYIRLSTVVRF